MFCDISVLVKFHFNRTQTKTNFAAMKLSETKKDTEYQQTKRGLG